MAHEPRAGGRPKVPGEDAGCPVRRDPDGGWRLGSYEAVRALLRSTETRQAGFAVEQAATLPKRMRLPVLWRDGPEHREDRRQTARFFTARRVESSYREMMTRIAAEQCAVLVRRGSADVSRLSFALAVAVTAEVIGLVPSRPGMARRLERFFDDPRAEPGAGLRGMRDRARAALSMGGFYLADVRPKVRARRRQRRDDLVSHLIDQGCTDGEILGECLTFAAAGMVTTREFITVATWHLLTDEALRADWDAGDPAARTAILHELLRLEPVVRALHRTTTADVAVPGPDGPVTIPTGARVRAVLTAANADPAAAGTDVGLSFGDGPHRCPGSHVAVRQSEIFLSALLDLPGLRLTRPPTIRIRAEIEAYELTGLVVAVS